MIRLEQGTIRRELIGFAGIVERNVYLIRRFAWWELAWYLYFTGYSGECREALVTWWAQSVGGRQPVVERYAELNRGFDAWKREHTSSDRRLPTPEYLLLHSFSPILFR